MSETQAHQLLMTHTIRTTLSVITTESDVVNDKLNGMMNDLETMAARAQAIEQDLERGLLEKEKN